MVKDEANTFYNKRGMSSFPLTCVIHNEVFLRASPIKRGTFKNVYVYIHFTQNKHIMQKLYN